MAITISMISAKNGEIKKFLESFSQKEVFMEEDINRWMYVFNKPLKAIDIISALMDNINKFQISMFLQVEDGDLHVVDENNYNDIIKGILYLYYKETQDSIL